MTGFSLDREPLEPSVAERGFIVETVRRYLTMYEEVHRLRAFLGTADEFNPDDDPRFKHVEYYVARKLFNRLMGKCTHEDAWNRPFDWKDGDPPVNDPIGEKQAEAGRRAYFGIIL